MRPRTCVLAVLFAVMTLTVSAVAHAQPPFFLKWGSPGTANGEFNDPSGIAVNASGDVYVADTQNHRIQKFDGSGSHLLTWGTYGTGNGQFDRPRGIGVDGAGNVYVTDATSRIQKFSSDGTFLTAWGSFGSGDGQM